MNDLTLYSMDSPPEQEFDSKKYISERFNFGDLLEFVLYVLRLVGTKFFRQALKHKVRRSICSDKPSNIKRKRRDFPTSPKSKG